MDPNDRAGVSRRVRTELDVEGSSPPVADVATRVHARIIGQERAISAICRGLETYEAGLTKDGMPADIYFLAGPPGIGKTETAYVLAEEWIGKLRKTADGDLIDPVTTIDCTQYTNRHDIATLTGSTKGYVGYDEDTPLSQCCLDRYHVEVLVAQKVQEYMRRPRPVRRKDKVTGVETVTQESPRPPSTVHVQAIRENVIDDQGPFRKVLLWDEISRSHKALWNLLISIMNGKPLILTNKTVTDFTGTVMLMTSNIAWEESRKVMKGLGVGIGFRGASAKPDDVHDAIYRLTLKQIEETFPGPFVSRIRDKIIVYRPLEDEDWRKILDLRLAEVVERFKARHCSGRAGHLAAVKFLFTDAYKGFLLGKGIDPLYGARRLGQVVDKYATAKLAVAVNRKSIRIADTIVFDWEPHPAPKGKVRVYREHI